MSISRFGYDTKIGKLHAGKRPSGAVYVEIENLDSQARAIELAIKALEVAAGAAGGAP